MSLTAVAELESLTQDQPDNPLRPNQIEEYHGELRRLGAMADGRDVDGNPQHWIPGDRGLARRRVREIQEALDRQAPKKVSGERANAIHKKAGEVLDVLRGAMLPKSTMRRNPAGAVGHVLRNEFSPEFKRAAKTWKRAMRALDPTNNDPDFTNLERFRSEGAGDGTSSVMVDAQIPGLFALSNRAKHNWPLGEATADTALKQAQRQEGARAAAAKPTKAAKRSPLADQVHACDAAGCGASYRGAIGRTNLARHKAKDHPAVTEGLTA